MKKIHRFLELNSQSDGRITEDRLLHQIGQVLKLKSREEAILFTDGGTERLVRFDVVSKKEITYTLLETREVATESPKKIIAALAITKGDHFELAVQKLSEFGIAEIIPLLSDRTIKNTVRLERLQTISDEAVELSGGTRRVKIHEPLTLEQALTIYTDPWIVCEKSDATTLPELKTGIFAVGPEGGWTDRELDLFKKNDTRLWSLGTRVLRAESAAIIGGYRLLWE